MTETPSCPSVAALDGLGASLRQDLGWLLLRSARGMHGLIAIAMSGLALDMRGAMVLKTISNGSAPSQLALAQAADIDKTTLVAVLDDLERKQLVRRTPDPADRRTRVVELTDEGRRILAWCESVISDVQRTVLESFDDDDRVALLRSLTQLIAAIDHTASAEC